MTSSSPLQPQPFCDFFFPIPIKDLTSPRRTIQSMAGQRFHALNPRTTTLLTASLQRDRAHIPAAYPQHHPTIYCPRFLRGDRSNVTLSVLAVPFVPRHAPVLG